MSVELKSKHLLSFYYIAQTFFHLATAFGNRLPTITTPILRVRKWMLRGWYMFIQLVCIQRKFGIVASFLIYTLSSWFLPSNFQGERVSTALLCAVYQNLPVGWRVGGRPCQNNTTPQPVLIIYSGLPVPSRDLLLQGSSVTDRGLQSPISVCVQWRKGWEPLQPFVMLVLPDQWRDSWNC